MGQQLIRTILLVSLVSLWCSWKTCEVCVKCCPWMETSPKLFTCVYLYCCFLCFILKMIITISHCQLCIVRWGTHHYMSLFLSVSLSIVHHISGSEHHLVIWYTYVEWWYLQVVFSFFKILIFWAFRGVKGQKIAQNEK